MLKSISTIIIGCLLLHSSLLGETQQERDKEAEHWQATSQQILDFMKVKEPRWVIQTRESSGLRGLHMAWKAKNDTIELWLNEAFDAKKASQIIWRHALIEPQPLPWCGNEGYTWPKSKTKIVCRKDRVYFRVTAPSSKLAKKLARYQIEFLKWN